MELIPEFDSFLIWSGRLNNTFIANIEDMHIISIDWFDIFKNFRNSGCPI